MTLVFYWLQALQVDMTGQSGQDRTACFKGLTGNGRPRSHCWLSSDYAPTVICLLLPPIGSGRSAPLSSRLSNALLLQDPRQSTCAYRRCQRGRASCRVVLKRAYLDIPFDTSREIRVRDGPSLRLVGLLHVFGRHVDSRFSELCQRLVGRFFLSKRQIEERNRFIQPEFGGPGLQCAIA